MKRKYIIGEEADLDLARISDHIALDNTTVAKRLMQGLKEKFKFLADQPYAGSSCDHIQPGLRYFAVSNYVIYHRVAKDVTEIVRVLHGAQDAESIFRQSE